MSTMEVSFPSSDESFCLYGDLTLPSLPPSSNDAEPSSPPLVPAIIIVAGSGPIDRLGNAPGMAFNTSNRFAEHILSTRQPRQSDLPSDETSGGGRSIAILSYDKRGVGKSIKKGDKNLYYSAGMMDFVSDAVEAVRFMSNHPRIDKKRIILLGHSEGAIILPLICREADRLIKNNSSNGSNGGIDSAGSGALEPIFGCIFYSGFGENIKDAMALQREFLLKEVDETKGITGWVMSKLITKERLEKQYNGTIAKINVPDEPDFISTLPFGMGKMPAKWLREHLDYDVHTSLKEYVKCHCLAITGLKDVQVHNEYCIPSTAQELVPHAKSIEVHRLENLTHALRSLEGESKLLNVKKDYGRLSKMDLDEELMKITDVWLDRVLFGVEKSG